MRRYRYYGIALAFALALSPTAGRAQQKFDVVVRRGWLGLSYDFMSERSDGKVTETVTVRDVVTGSPADKAGLKKGDRILRIDGKPLSEADFDRIARTMSAGDTVRLRVATANKERDVTVVAAARPLEYATMTLNGDSVQKMTRIFIESARGKLNTFEPLHADSLMVWTRRIDRLPFDSVFAGGRMRLFFDSAGGDRIMFGKGDFADGMIPRFELLGQRAVAGAEFEPINPGLAHYFGTDRGLLVLRVGPGTPAAQAGLQEGDVVLKAGERTVADVTEFRGIVMRAERDPLVLDVLRRGKSVKLNLELRRAR